jgi:precorrin-6Y C5,15-methyltransferase (decarboxylating)
MSAPWLTVIGVGDNGLDSLGAEARAALGDARTVIASRRVLDQIGPLQAETIDMSAGLSSVLALLQARRGTPVTLLATGDPMHFGIGATLLRSFAIEEMRVLPSPSAFSLAAARMGWPLQDVACISLHGRDTDRLIAHLAQGRRIVALTSDASTIAIVSELLVSSGYGASRISVLEHMGGARERRSDFVARDLPDDTFADFNTLAVECRMDRADALHGTAPGLPDTAFVHDGQMTKQEVRAVVLSLLRPGGGQHLWDVGAGCGSISIEWLRADPLGTASAIEPVAERRDMMSGNACALGVPHLSIVEGKAPEALAGLPAPDAVFIGGSVTGEGVFDAAHAALPPFGRLVATAVTLESEARLLALQAIHGGQLIRLSVARAEPVGRFQGWKPSMPVTVWSLIRADAS